MFYTARVADFPQRLASALKVHADNIVLAVAVVNPNYDSELNRFVLEKFSKPAYCSWAAKSVACRASNKTAASAIDYSRECNLLALKPLRVGHQKKVYDLRTSVCVITGSELVDINTLVSMVDMAVKVDLLTTNSVNNKESLVWAYNYMRTSISSG